MCYGGHYSALNPVSVNTHRKFGENTHICLGCGTPTNVKTLKNIQRVAVATAVAGYIHKT